MQQKLGFSFTPKGFNVSNPVSEAQLGDEIHPFTPTPDGVELDLIE